MPVSSSRPCLDEGHLGIAMGLEAQGRTSTAARSIQSTSYGSVADVRHSAGGCQARSGTCSRLPRCPRAAVSGSGRWLHGTDRVVHVVNPRRRSARRVAIRKVEHEEVALARALAADRSAGVTRRVFVAVAIEHATARRAHEVITLGHGPPPQTWSSIPVDRRSRAPTLAHAAVTASLSRPLMRCTASSAPRGPPPSLDATPPHRPIAPAERHVMPLRRIGDWR